MNSVYLAIWYGCNQKCKGCPCGKDTDKSKSLSYEDVVNIVDSLMIKYPSGFSITMSGGEPTLHPDFLKILRYIKNKNIKLTILSNSEKFYDMDFVEQFIENCNIFNTTVVTTIHNSDPLVHEEQNQSKGSYKRSIEGLENIFKKGIKVILKHCITKVNYKDTKDFLLKMNNTFHPSVSFQLWGIDYCGLDKKEAEKLYVNYQELSSYLEEALDEVIKIQNKNGRVVSLYNIPLCWVDPYYWNLMPMGTNKKVYSSYIDPSTKEENSSDGAGCHAKKCEICNVKEYCSGTYKSTFEYFGEDCVNNIEAVKQ